MENVDSNTIIENNEEEELDFRYNFVEMPWDDRSNKSKFGIIALLIAIFLATLACVANSFVMHYKAFKHGKSLNSSEVNCQLVKMEDYPYVVRIESLATEELVCVGALITQNSILASGACVKSGPVRMKMGNSNEPRCKKGFTVDFIEPVYHNGVISKKLVLMSSYGNMADCAQVIRIGTNIDLNSRAYIIGRNMHGGRSLSRQPVNVAGKDCVCSGMFTKNMNNKGNILCVKGLARCPVLAGDLLVQNGFLFGLASTSVQWQEQNKQACFADLKIIYKELQELDNDV